MAQQRQGQTAATREHQAPRPLPSRRAKKTTKETHGPTNAKETCRKSSEHKHHTSKLEGAHVIFTNHPERLKHLTQIHQQSKEDGQPQGVEARINPAHQPRVQGPAKKQEE
mmetsp:Transcript_12983/g.28190  ORF Transcript_12983/g.28190 Transcript_12983/m.28190 type:complete len:111 (+) Transcript_12983:142-474(+)